MPLARASWDDAQGRGTLKATQDRQGHPPSSHHSNVGMHTVCTTRSAARHRPPPLAHPHLPPTCPAPPGTLAAPRRTHRPPPPSLSTPTHSFFSLNTNTHCRTPPILEKLLPLIPFLHSPILGAAEDRASEHKAPPVVTAAELEKPHPKAFKSFQDCKMHSFISPALNRALIAADLSQTQATDAEAKGPALLRTPSLPRRCCAGRGRQELALPSPFSLDAP